MLLLSEANFSALNVLESIHGYVWHFFGCRECANNFEKGAKHIPSESLEILDVEPRRQRVYQLVAARYICFCISFA